jgi:hypothetical protein
LKNKTVGRIVIRTTVESNGVVCHQRSDVAKRILRFFGHRNSRVVALCVR